MKPHIYKGSISVCLTCFRLENDPIHIIIPSGVHTVVGADEPEITQSNIVSNIAAFNEPEKLSIFEPVDPESDPGPLPLEDEVIPIIGRVTGEEAITCDGHKCPKCSVTWYHDYDCQGKKVNGLCQGCASGVAVEINRPVEIEQLAQTSSVNLSGHEVAALMLEHEDFVVWNLIYEVKDGEKVERADWQEKINEHRRDLKRLIEKFRVKELATSKVLQQKYTEDIGKLSLEEIEQYKRDARKSVTKSKNGVAATPKEPKKIDAKESYEKMLKGLCSSIRNKKPGLSEDEVITRAKKQYEILQGEED